MAWTSMSLRVAGMLVGALFAAAPAAWAAEWSPTRPIRLINLFPAGDSSDSVARLIAQRMSDSLGQQVIVDNRPGAGGIVGLEIAARAAPDGHTLVLVASSFTVYRLLHPKLPFDPLTALTGVALTTSSPLVLGSTMSLAARTGPELIALAKSRPGQVNFGSSGNATSSHLAGELFKSMAGIDITHVPYKGATPAINDLIAGQIQIMFSSALQMVPIVQTGRVRGLGVTSAKRLPVMPDVPAVAEFVPGYELSPWFGILAPSASPKPAIERLSREIRKTLERPDVQEFYAKQGAVPVHMAPAEFSRFIEVEATRWQGLVKRVGVKVE